MVRLDELIQHLTPIEPPAVDERSIGGITYDSRRVQPGQLFVALPGSSTDGHKFIPSAIRNGAAAIVGSQSMAGLAVPYIRVADCRQALALLSAAYYGFPARQMTVIGVTGTDGKTTTSSLIYQILLAAGRKTGLITTVSALIAGQALDTGFHVTTPEAPDVQRYLAEMVAAGLDHVVLEATSHGLDQQRVAACDFDIGVVTNITHEHLDYHGSYEAYRLAKARLFTSLSATPLKPAHPPRAAVLNRDDQSFEYLAGLVTVRQVTYGLSPGAQISATQIESRAGSLCFSAQGLDGHGNWFSMPVETNLEGAYNVSNCLAALAVGINVLGLAPEAVQQGLAALPGIPGRMERIDLNAEHPGLQDFIAFVDFAHTPNALRKTLEAARSLASGRLIAIFGSAGLRDRAKRRMMAETSAELADISVLTAEDPRTESLSKILSEMADGVRARGGVEGKNFWRIPDRRAALRFAIQIARAGDVLVACGKGHEQSMCFGETEYPWDDRQAMRAALADRYGLPGPGMPYLPEPEEN